ncbi:MAG: hypothetical protein ACM36C_09615 [Acidobacteriota bacterium]
MELRRLRRHVINRGGLTEAWLVYVEDRDPDLPGTGCASPRPRLVKAFWSRSEATEWARAEQVSRKWDRYEVYHVALDEQWVSNNTLRPAQHVPLSEGGPPHPDITVTPGAIAHAFG